MMWYLFRTRVPRLASSAVFKNPRFLKTSLATVSSFSLLLTGSIIANDQSNNSLDGVSVDSSIDAFSTKISPFENKIFSSDYKLIASGVRSVTFVGFKVYGVGLYIPEKHEKTIVSVISEHLKQNPSETAQTLLENKTLSQEIIADLASKVPYAVKITPVRNTDYGHLRDGLTKSILANPMAKTIRDEVTTGVEQLREVFAGFRGSVPKNDTLWVVSNTRETQIFHQGKDLKPMGTVSEPAIATVLLVSYLSSVKPLSEPLRKDFVHYVTKWF